MNSGFTKLEVVFRDATDPILIEDLDGTVIDMNEQAVRAYGFTREELIGRPIKTIVLPERHAQADDLLVRCRSGEDVRDIEGVRITKSGDQIHVLLSLSLLKDDTGVANAIATFAKDIGPLRAAEEENRQLTRVFRDAADPILLEDLDGIVFDLNTAAERLYGWTRDELVNQPIKTIVPESRHEQADEILARCKAGEEVRNIEGMRITKDGYEIPVLITLSLLKDDSGRPTGIASFAKEITAQKEAEAEARQLSGVFRDAADPIILEDLDGVIIDLNSSAVRLYGWSREELIGEPIKVLVPEANHAQADELLNRCKAGEEVRNIEGRRVTKDGVELSVLLTLSLLHDDSGKVSRIASFAKEITAQKEAEAELKRLAEELETRVEKRTADLREAREVADAANRAKSDFLANMSHEIRTPMNGIMGMTELALGTELSREQREFLMTIESSAESLLTLINDILDFSKIEAKKLELDPIDFELRERIGETLTTLATRAHSKGLELAFEVDSEVPEHLHGDVHRIRQVLVNLLGNAIKFTEQGEIVLRVELVRIEQPKVTLRFVVTDTGIGMSPKVVESIFLPFEQADVSTTRKYGGTGLGLAICNQLVGLMGGEMSVESELGGGTTFEFTIELQIAKREALPSRKPSESSPESLQGLRVLVVDDNNTNRRILCKMLENWGMIPVAADSAAEGLEVLQLSQETKPIQLVVSDVNMPEIDGFMFAEEIMKHHNWTGTPVILLTSANRSGDAARCRDLGIAAHLLKPARQSFLFDAIATSVGGNSETEMSTDQIEIDVARDGKDEIRRDLRVLLAEDNETNQKFAIRALKKAGHTVHVANNGQEALDAWKSDFFDVILMDIQMPVMDGYAATGAIRKIEADAARHTPIIAMTAHAMKGDQEKCLAAGMDGYVTKPIKTKVMHAEISRVLSSMAPQVATDSSPETNS